MLKTFRYRLYPTSAQERKLLSALDLCRNLYNGALEERRSFYKKFNKSPTYFDQIKALSEVKELCPEYKDIHSQISQDVLRRLEKSYQNFFRRIKTGEKPGFPRFLSRDRYKSFTFPQSGFRIENDRLHLSKIGPVKISLHREILGKIKTCTIIKTSTNKWYCCFSTEVEKQALPKTWKMIGIDLGIKNFITTSDGKTVASKKFFNKHLERLALASRRHSKKRTHATKLHAARVHEKVKSCRSDWQHKVANRIVRENDIIVVEDLNIKKMKTSDKFGSCMKRHISDASWGQLIFYLSYKAEYADKRVILVDPANTSKMCSRCGCVKDLGLDVRIYRCEHCGLEMDRDHNAAINIKNLGLEIMKISNPKETRDIFSDREIKKPLALC